MSDPEPFPGWWLIVRHMSIHVIAIIAELFSGARSAVHRAVNALSNRSRRDIVTSE
jgi:hypothetical protein